MITALPKETERRKLLQKLFILKVIILLLAGFTAWVSVAHFSSKIPFARVETALLLYVGLMSLSIVRLRLRFPVTNLEILLLLSADAFLLGYLIYIGGASSNPFTSSIFVPIALAAALLPRKYSIWLLVSAIAVYSFWVVTDSHVHHRGLEADPFQLHLFGMWFNFVVSALLLYFFVSYAAESMTKGERQLRSAREKILQNERLVAIANLTASTAHALGTPISTLAILSEDVSSSEPLNQKQVKILKKQIEICREHLKNLTKMASNADSLKNEVSTHVAEFVDELKTYFSLVLPGANIVFNVDSKAESIRIESGQSLKLAIANLIENAWDAAVTRVDIQVYLSNRLVIEITDDGDGIALESLEEMGKPFISSKESGLGLGVYLTNSTIESAGGSIVMNNLPSQGAKITVELPTLSDHEK